MMYLLLRIDKLVLIGILLRYFIRRAGLLLDSHAGYIIAGGRKMICILSGCVILSGKTIVSSRFRQVPAIGEKASKPTGLKDGITRQGKLDGVKAVPYLYSILFLSWVKRTTLLFSHA